MRHLGLTSDHSVEDPKISPWVGRHVVVRLPLQRHLGISGSCSIKGSDPFLDLSSEDAQYSYCANGPVAVFFSVLFGLTWIAHVIQAVIYRKKFCWVIVVGTLWECIGLVMRTYSTIDQTQANTASAGQLLVLLAPLWVNAFVYMIFGRMVYYYLPEKKVIGIRAEKLAKIFIWLDVR